MINGSPRNGNTLIALEEAKRVFEANEIDTTIINVGAKPIRGCIACGKCYKTGRCVMNDIVNEVLPLLEECDALIVASPVYYASANGTLISFLDRLFYANHADLSMKVASSIVVARRGGASSTFDELNKYFTISGMPIASSYYWNSVHGKEIGEAHLDLEGIETVINLANNMIFLMKAISDAKAKYGLPKRIKGAKTNFIR